MTQQLKVLDDYTSAELLAGWAKAVEQFKPMLSKIPTLKPLGGVCGKSGVGIADTTLEAMHSPQDPAALLKEELEAAEKAHSILSEPGRWCRYDLVRKHTQRVPVLGFAAAPLDPYGPPGGVSVSYEERSIYQVCAMGALYLAAGAHCVDIGGDVFLDGQIRPVAKRVHRRLLTMLGGEPVETFNDSQRSAGPVIDLFRHAIRDIKQELAAHETPHDTAEENHDGADTIGGVLHQGGSRRPEGVQQVAGGGGAGRNAQRGSPHLRDTAKSPTDEGQQGPRQCNEEAHWGGSRAYPPEAEAVGPAPEKELVAA